MPVIETREPGIDEFELPTIRVPATLSTATHEFGNLGKARGSQGTKYIGASITNDSTARVTLRDDQGREYDVIAGQVADLDFLPGSGNLTLIPAADIEADKVFVVLRLRKEA